MDHTAGDWIVHNTGTGLTTTSVIISTKKNGALVVGLHPNDPDTSIVLPNDVIGNINATERDTHMSEGNVVRYTTEEGKTSKGIILSIRPDNKIVVGEHRTDPDAITVDTDEVHTTAMPSQTI
jgi:hypothetical protein